MDFFTKILRRKKTPVLMWGHGWGQTHESLLASAESLRAMGQHILVDFPGFGNSPIPPDHWGSVDYADQIAAWLKDQGIEEIIWAGHSFGGRVGIQLAARYPKLVKGMVLIAAAGLKRKWPIHKKVYFWLRMRTYKFLRSLRYFGLNEDWLKRKFGSPDYINAGPMRPILVRVVNEDLTELAKNVFCPTLLIYGSKDNQTPPEFGHRYQRLFRNSEFHIIKDEDHYSILTTGRHPVASLVKKFIERLYPNQEEEDTA